MEKLRISKVKFTNSGLKGLEVHYEKVTIKDEREFRNEHIDKIKAPVHYELEKWMQALKKDLLDICGYGDDEREREILMNQLEVCGVTAGEKAFLIVGKMKVIGNKTINLVTPLIKDDDECDNYDSAQNIIKAIYEETLVYMEGAVMEDEQLVMKFNQGKEEFNEKEFMEMSATDKRRIATEILEKQGCIVIHSEETDEKEPELEDNLAIDTPPVEDVEIEVRMDLLGNKLAPAVEKVSDDEFSLEDDVNIDLEEEPEGILEEEDDFLLEVEVTPVKQSTATKIKV
jgi:hypothetical protein